MTKIFKPWVLVTLGIAFNISSAVITHYFIDINNQNIHHLENRINNIDTLIESQWRTKTQVDRKEEFLLSMLTRSKYNEDSANNDIQNLMEHQLSELIKQQDISLQKALTNPIQKFSTITAITTQAKNNIINTINSSYLERLELDSQRIPLSEDNALLSTLAIFLQLSGLILVLSKDINS